MKTWQELIEALLRYENIQEMTKKASDLTQDRLKDHEECEGSLNHKDSLKTQKNWQR